MRFSVYQVSRKGGREKNEDRMGYCYTRDSGLFALADGMGGHPEGEVASQLALQTLAALFQRDAKPVVKDPLRFLHDSIIAGHHQLLRYATEKCADRYAAHHRRRLRAAGQRRLLGALRRLAAVPGARRQADRAHPRPLVFRAAGNAQPRRADGRALQSQRAVHLPRQPGQAGGRYCRPAAAAPGRSRSCCAPTACGAAWPTPSSPSSSPRGPIPDAVPELVELALRKAGSKSDNVTALSVEWESAEDFDSTKAISTQSLGEEVFASTIQASVLGQEPDELDEAEIERSIREINEAIKRSSQKKT